MFARLRSFVRTAFGRRWQDDVYDEIAFHIAARAEHFERRGIPHDEAQRRARVEFGATAECAEACRMAHGARWFDELRRNLLYAARSMRRSRGLTAIALLSLALGIGANIAVFGVVQRLLLTKLPVRDPDSLHQVVLITSSGTRYGMPYAKYALLRDNIPAFDQLFGWMTFGTFQTTIGGVEQAVSATVVSGDYFDDLGVRPAAGRLLTNTDEHRADALVLGHDFWKNVLARDPTAIGRVLSLRGFNGVLELQVVGVAPPGFSGLQPGSAPDVYLPLEVVQRLRPQMLISQGAFAFHVMGRLKPTVPPDAASAMLRERWPELDEPFRLQRGNTGKREIMVLEDGSRGFSPIRDTFSKALLVLTALVAAIFLIVCANLATLLFIRGAGRLRETSVRLALGASRGQLIRQWMTECLLLAFAGGIVALLAARWITDLLLVFVNESDRVWLRFRWDPVILAASIALTVVAGGLFGLLPGIRATRTSPEAMLRVHSATSTARRSALANGVLAAQLAASLLLVTGAALFAATLWNLNKTAGGFERSVTVYGDVNLSRIPQARRAAVMREVLDRLRASPHVVRASTGDVPILWGGSSWTPVQVPGHVYAPDEDNIAFVHFADPGYFTTVGIPIVTGREFEPQDREPDPNSPKGTGIGAAVAIVNEAFARHYFPGERAVGRLIKPWNFPAIEIIGVAKDTKEKSLRDRPKDLIYRPLAANAARALLARVKPGVATSIVESEIVSILGEVARDASVHTGRIEDAVQDSLRMDRLVAQLSAAFGVLGIILAAIGLYGAIAHSVSSRTREIGIRIAIGAEVRRVMWLVLKEALTVTGIGIAVGVPLAVVASRVFAPLLFGVSASDPRVLALSVGVLGSVALIAAFFPARRAARLDPAQTLRYE